MKFRRKGNSVDSQEDTNRDNTIKGPVKKDRSPNSSVENVETPEGSTVGSRAASRKSKKQDPDIVVEKEVVEEDKVAIWSPRPIHASRSLHIPSLESGFNIVTNDQAKKWMKLKKDVRLATPEEVAAHYDS